MPIARKIPAYDPSRSLRAKDVGYNNERQSINTPAAAGFIRASFSIGIR
jgi:hypothetical protein